MKFWQLLSIFNDEKTILEQELKNTEWHYYAQIYEDFGTAIRLQKREVLDLEVSNKFLKRVCLESRKKIYLSNDNRILYSYKNLDTQNEIAISEAIELYNHDNIEEVFEKTYANARTI